VSRLAFDVSSKKSELTSPFSSRVARVMAMASTPALGEHVHCVPERCAALKALAPLRDRPDHSDLAGAARLRPIGNVNNAHSRISLTLAEKLAESEC
jgi:hypothetical protein